MLSRIASCSPGTMAQPVARVKSLYTPVRDAPFTLES
jgi:hypothetical protein